MDDNTELTNDVTQEQPADGLTASGEASVHELAATMENDQTEQTETVDSNDNMLISLLSELDSAGEKLSSLEENVEGNISNQLDLMSESVRVVVEKEKTRLYECFELMSEGILLIGPSGELERGNPAVRKMLGLDDDKSLESLQRVVDELGLCELVETGRVKDGRKQGDFNFKSGDGKMLQMRWSEALDSEGYSLGCTVIIKNITDEIAGQKAKSDFIAAISHELRTPLTSLQNSISNILAGVTGKIGKPTRKYLTTMEADCHRYAGLISDLLDVSKLETGSMPLNRSVTRIETIVNSSLSAFGDIAVSKGVKLLCEVDRHIMPIYADSQRLEQVLANLLDNAIKFTDSGDRVTIGAYETSENIIMMVEDTGPGIPESSQEKIFEKFYQIGREAGAGYKGAGLGLAICSGIIEGHGGSIWVESEEDKGSRFNISLPKTKPETIVHRHLNALSEKIGSEDATVGVILVKLDSSSEDEEALRISNKTVIRHILADSMNLLTEPGDLAIQMSDSEVTLISRECRGKSTEKIVDRVRKIVANDLKKKLGQGIISPMLGVGVYPKDSDSMTELAAISRKGMQKMF